MQQCGIVSLCLQTDCLGQTEFIFIKQIGPNWAVQILLSRTWCMAVICSICHQGHAGLMLQEAYCAQIELQLLAKMSIMPWKLLFEAVSSPEGLNQHVKFQSGCFSLFPSWLLRSLSKSSGDRHSLAGSCWQGLVCWSCREAPGRVGGGDDGHRAGGAEQGAWEAAGAGCCD